MKLFSLLVCILMFISCNNTSNNESQNNIPQALQDNTKPVFTIKSHSGREDLVDDLYNEMVDKDAELRKIDNLYKELRGQKKDSLEKFLSFDQKNHSYYQSAASYLKMIKDSILQKEIETILQNSKNRYQVKKGRLTALENVLDLAESSADDSHFAIKLLVTLRIMESYQENLPSSKPIESLITDYNDLRRKMDSIVIKNKPSQPTTNR